MARSARLVVPGCPHHVTQRGNRRQKVFFDDADYRDYIALMAASCAKAGTMRHVRNVAMNRHSRPSVGYVPVSGPEPGSR